MKVDEAQALTDLENENFPNKLSQAEQLAEVKARIDSASKGYWIEGVDENGRYKVHSVTRDKKYFKATASPKGFDTKTQVIGGIEFEIPFNKDTGEFDYAKNPLLFQPSLTEEEAAEMVDKGGFMGMGGMPDVEFKDAVKAVMEESKPINQLGLNTQKTGVDTQENRNGKMTEQDGNLIASNGLTIRGGASQPQHSKDSENKDSQQNEGLLTQAHDFPEPQQKEKQIRNPYADVTIGSDLKDAYDNSEVARPVVEGVLGQIWDSYKAYKQLATDGAQTIADGVSRHSEGKQGRTNAAAERAVEKILKSEKLTGYELKALKNQNIFDAEMNTKIQAYLKEHY
jgi:hypothetical protein